MDDRPDMRASDADRQEAIERLPRGGRIEITNVLLQVPTGSVRPYAASGQKCTVTVLQGLCRHDADSDESCGGDPYAIGAARAEDEVIRVVKISDVAVTRRAAVCESQRAQERAGAAEQSHVGVAVVLKNCEVIRSHLRCRKTRYIE